MRESICVALKSLFRKTEKLPFMIQVKFILMFLAKMFINMGPIRIKLKLESFQNNHWIMVGIVKADVVPNGPDSYFCPGAYGWSLGDDAQLYKGGVLKGSRLSWKKMSKQGDTVELGLDCDGGRLSLYLSTGQLFNMVIPKSQCWRLHVNLYGTNDKIRIVEVVQD